MKLSLLFKVQEHITLRECWMIKYGKSIISHHYVEMKIGFSCSERGSAILLFYLGVSQNQMVIPFPCYCSNGLKIYWDEGIGLQGRPPSKCLHSGIGI